MIHWLACQVNNTVGLYLSDGENRIFAEYHRARS